MRTLCRALGAGQLAPATILSGFAQPDVRIHHDRAGGPVTAAPAIVVGVIDGIERRIRITTRDGLPVVLEYAAAGLRDTGGGVSTAMQRVWVSCSYRHETAVRQAAGHVPVEAFGEHRARPLTIATHARVQAVRRQLEQDLAREHEPAVGRLLVVDGSITDLVGTRNLAGVVKDVTSTAWLADREEIETLPQGHLSTPFTILADGRHRADVLSAYLRLHVPEPDDSWDHGLVRLESADEADLGPLAAWCLQQRQGQGSGDPRWACHLAPIKHLEDGLRALAPQY